MRRLRCRSWMLLVVGALIAACNLSPNIDLPSNTREPEASDPTMSPGGEGTPSAGSSGAGGTAGASSCFEGLAGAGGARDLPSDCGER